MALRPPLAKGLPFRLLSTEILFFFSGIKSMQMAHPQHIATLWQPR